MTHQRSGRRRLRTVRLFGSWLAVLVLVAMQVFAPVAQAAPAAPAAAPAAAPSAPTSTINLHAFAARSEPDADIGPVTEGQAVSVYKWMINEDNTGSNAQRNPNTGSGCSPADAGYPDSCKWTSIASLRSSAPVVAQGDETTLDGNTGITLPAGRYLISVLADGYKLDGTPFTIPADPGTIEVPLQPLPLPTATASAEVFADVTSANGQYDPGEDGLSGFTGKITDYLGQVNTDVFGNPLCTTYKAGSGPNGYEWVDGGPVVDRLGGKCLSGDANMDGVINATDEAASAAGRRPGHRPRPPPDPEPRPQPLRDARRPPDGPELDRDHDPRGQPRLGHLADGGRDRPRHGVRGRGRAVPGHHLRLRPGPDEHVPASSSSTYWQRPDSSFAAGGTGTIKGVVNEMKVYVPTTGGACLPGTIWGGLCGGKVVRPDQGRVDRPLRPWSAATPPSSSFAPARSTAPSPSATCPPAPTRSPTGTRSRTTSSISPR